MGLGFRVQYKGCGHLGFQVVLVVFGFGSGQGS